jgi:hypothetical protein
MKTTKTQRAIEFFRRMESLGIDYSTAQRLRRIEMTLHRWAEAECNGDIQRSETTGKPLRFYGMNYVCENEIRGCYAIPDKETGALKRLAAVMAGFPHLWFYYQTDPRGCALYVGRKSDLRPDQAIDCQYSRGVAVCF